MQKTNRVWEIDFIRGIAIILMVIFHFIVDLKDFYFYNIEYMSGFWYHIGRISALLFITVSGISCSFSRNNINRGIKVFLFGLVLTFATFFILPQSYIRFGILHFLGLSMILYDLIKKLDIKIIAVIGLISFVLGNIFSKLTVESSYLFPIGLINNSFSSMDYYPLFPWFGIFILGAIIGKTLYRQKKSAFKFSIENTFISRLGNHSLSIYLLHQPILLGILYLFHSF